MIITQVIALLQDINYLILAIQHIFTIGFIIIIENRIDNLRQDLGLTNLQNKQKRNLTSSKVNNYY